MSLKSGIDFFRTVTFRLAIWYVLLFTLSSSIVFLIIYYRLSSRLKSQVDLDLLSKAKEFKTLYQEQGINALRSEFQREANSRGIRHVFFLLSTIKGDILISSDLSLWKVKRLFTKALPDRLKFKTIFIRSHRKARLIFMPVDDNHVLVCGVELRNMEIIQERLRETFGTALAIILVLGGLAGYFISQKAMSGVQRVTKTAIQIQKSGDLSKRVPLGKEGLEIEDLVKAFNKMLDRIELLIKELKDVTDNIAHDLRSPITKIRGITETTLMGSAGLKEFQDMGAKVIEECDRLTGMINTMLEITKTEAGILELKKEKLNINEIIKDAIDLFYPLAEDKGIKIEEDIPPEPTLIYADRSKIQRAIANILDNAIKYTPKGGKIRVAVNSLNEKASIIVEDTGIGIKEKDLPHIFDRFYRAEQSRTSPGTGLGLSLAKAIVEAHGGKIQVTSAVGKGSKFLIILTKW